MLLTAVDGRWFGTYMAQVAEHILEPDGSGHGCIRVTCQTVYGANLSPCVFPMSGIGGGGYTNPDGATKPTGLFSVPPIGATVGIMFLGGDLQYPFYFGGWWGAPNGNSEVPVSPRQTTPAGDPGVTILETEAWRIFLEDTSGSEQLRIERKGNEDTAIEVTSTEDVVLRSKPVGGQESVITIDGTSGTITIDGDTEIKLGASATEKLVLGSTFLTLYNAHTHPDPVSGTTGTPTAPMVDLTHLSQKAKTE